MRGLRPRSTESENRRGQARGGWSPGTCCVTGPRVSPMPPQPQGLLTSHAVSDSADYVEGCPWGAPTPLTVLTALFGSLSLFSINPGARWACSRCRQSCEADLSPDPQDQCSVCHPGPALGVQAIGSWGAFVQDQRTSGLLGEHVCMCTPAMPLPARLGPFPATHGGGALPWRCVSVTGHRLL